MKYIGLRWVHMTSSSCPIIGASLNKIKSINFYLPTDCEIISDNLSNNSVLKQLELHGINSVEASHKILGAIRHNDNIETLILDYGPIKECVADIVKLLEHSRTLKQLTIKSQESSQEILLIAKSLTVSKSVKIFKYGDMNMNLAMAFKFLEQIKQAYRVEEVVLGLSPEAYHHYKFLGDVEKCVQQINHARGTIGASSLLKVEITYGTLP